MLALENKELEHKAKLEAITRLIQEHYTIREYDKAQQHLQQAKEIYELAKNKYYYKFFDYIIQVYTHLLNDDVKKFKSVLADDFIPYLKQQGDYGHLIIYAKLLAAKLEEIGKYKESVQYYKLASNSYNNLIKL